MGFRNLTARLTSRLPPSMSASPGVDSTDPPWHASSPNRASTSSFLNLAATLASPSERRCCPVTSSTGAIQRPSVSISPARMWSVRCSSGASRRHRPPSAGAVRFPASGGDGLRSVGELAPMEKDPVRLTQFSHGAGCGCKIAPGVLDRILGQLGAQTDDPRLLVGHGARMTRRSMTLWVTARPLCPPPISSCPSWTIRTPSGASRRPMPSATSTPWAAPRSWPSPSSAGPWTSSTRRWPAVCSKGGAPSVPKPAFRWPAATASILLNPFSVWRSPAAYSIARLKRNGGAQVGDLLYLSKPLGVGDGHDRPEKGGGRRGALDSAAAAANMMHLNKVGTALGDLDGVHAMTDVTGFGLAGHGFGNGPRDGSGSRVQRRWPCPRWTGRA